VLLQFGRILFFINYITFNEIETIVIFNLLVIIINNNTSLLKADYTRRVVCGAIWGVPMKLPTEVDHCGFAGTGIFDLFASVTLTLT